MGFQIGDWVIHCAHGLGQVRAIEEKINDNKTSLYYAIELSGLAIWVPVEEGPSSRLRPPASAEEFRALLATLSEPAEQLSNDRRQRNLQLQEILRDGSVAALCRTLRNLAAYRHQRTWNEYDSALMNRAQKALVTEWSFVLSVPPYEAEAELQRLLSIKTK